MSYEKFSFRYFLQHYSGPNKSMIEEMFSIFGNEIESIPYDLCSSKSIRHHLTIDSPFKDCLFRTVFLEYFKQKLLECNLHY